jgi:hypothetical protein
MVEPTTPGYPKLWKKMPGQGLVQKPELGSSLHRALDDHPAGVVVTDDNGLGWPGAGTPIDRNNPPPEGRLAS